MEKFSFLFIHTCMCLQTSLNNIDHMSQTVVLNTTSAHATQTAPKRVRHQQARPLVESKRPVQGIGQCYRCTCARWALEPLLWRGASLLHMFDI